MRTPRVPEEIVGGLTGLRDRLQVVTGGCSGTGELVSLVERLNTALLDAPCFFDRLTSEWRYDFGHPIVGLPNGQVALGAHMFTPVRELVDSLVVASRRLKEPGLTEYLRRLTDSSRHQDALVEMIPVGPLGEDVGAEFEVPAEGPNGGTIDWCVTPSVGPRLLFDVKNRVADLIPYLGAVTDAASTGSPIPAPEHNPDVLFRGLVNKFAEHVPNECAHGAWVFTRVKQEESLLRAAFEATDAARLHFAVVSNRKRECILLSRQNVDRQHILESLLLAEEPSRVVFQRHEG